MFGINEPVTVIATSNEELDEFMAGAKFFDMKVRSTSLYDGPVPDGSFYDIAPGVRMATPEYMFLRKANELDEISALLIGCELMSRYTTDIINPNVPEGVARVGEGPHTNLADLTAYLLQVVEYEEGERAMELLDKLPMTMPLYLSIISDYEFVER